MAQQQLHQLQRFGLERNPQRSLFISNNQFIRHQSYLLFNIQSIQPLCYTYILWLRNIKVISYECYSFRILIIKLYVLSVDVESFIIQIMTLINSPLVFMISWHCGLSISVIIELTPLFTLISGESSSSWAISTYPFVQAMYNGV